MAPVAKQRTTNSNGADERALASLAFLNIKWDEQSDSYVDNFVPFAVHALKKSDSAVISAQDVMKAVEQDFGIHLPLGVVETILSRAVRKGYATRRQGVLAPDRVKLETFDISSDRGTAERLLSVLIGKVVAFASSQHGLELADDEAERLLLDYVSERSLPLLRSVVRSAPYQPTLDESASDWFLIASFVTHVYARDSEAFDALGVIVKGSMLAAVVYSPDLGKIQQRFSDLVLLLDTPILLRLLGLTSEVQAEAAREMVVLAKSLGADVGICR
jgi:hypothetical protein